MTIFFTSDSHFGHSNVIKYAKRPFKNTTEMDNFMIKSWQETVKNDDIIFFLGDFSFGNTTESRRIFDLLTGTKHLVTGNHDDRHTRNLPWASVNDYVTIKKPTPSVPFLVLFHYPIESWNGVHHGSVHLHGHSHGNIPHNKQRIDVGVDCWGFIPQTLEAMLDATKDLPYPDITDHHTKKNG